MASLQSAAAKGQRKIQQMTQERFCAKRVAEGFVSPQACAEQYNMWKLGTQNWSQNYIEGMQNQ